ncbi:MAG TPA: hypothetical protein IAC41_01960 [Candidatus Merdenecus merdavium]|nr:hypothetical protein [Candidatus Merdenecus merdavium]
MKKSVLMDVVELQRSLDKTVRVEYYFVKDYRFEEDSRPLCGIKIVKWESRGTEVKKEIEIAPAISYSEKFVKQMIQKMVKNMVTPIHMLEVIDDLVTEESYHCG